MNIIPLPLPSLEIAILTAIVGALCVSRLRDPLRAWKVGLAITGVCLLCTLLAWAGFNLTYLVDPAERDWSLETHFFGMSFLGVDELNAPLLPMVGLLHFLTALATGRTKMRRFSLSWSLMAEAICLATFGCTDGCVLAALLTAGTVPAFIELVNRGKPIRVYCIYMGLFIALLLLGTSCVDPAARRGTQTAWATVPLLAAVLIRSGVVPVHCWLTDWFEHASFGNALLFVTPLVGVYAAIKLVVPIAPEWMLHGIVLLSLITAVYAAGMAVVQREPRRFFAYLFLSHASLVLVGVELHTSRSLTGALALWISISLSLAGLGLTLRALEARFGRLSLSRFHGLYEHSPALAVCFALTGLCSVGFPGTLGFVATELIVEGAVEAGPYVGLAVVVAAAINGIAIVRAYFYLFTGTRHSSSVSLAIGWREQVAVLTLTALILGGGLFPQAGLVSRHRAADEILKQRESDRSDGATHQTRVE